MEVEELVQIGEITAGRGLKGEIKVVPTTSHPDAYLDLEAVTIIIENNPVVFNIVAMRKHQNLWLVLLEGVEDRDAADRLRGQGLFLEKDQLYPLNEDEFYIHDLINSEVYSTEEEYLGVIVKYFETGANGVCEVKRAEGDFLFPTTKEVLQDINTQEKRITIKVLPGLLDINKR